MAQNSIIFNKPGALVTYPRLIRNIDFRDLDRESESGSEPGSDIGNKNLRPMWD